LGLIKKQFMKIGDKINIPANLTIDPANKRGETGTIIENALGIVTVEFNDGTMGRYFSSVWDSKFAKGGNMNNQNKLESLKKRRAQLTMDMEENAEPQGGPIANKYGRELDKIDMQISKLTNLKPLTYGEALKMGKGGKLKYADYYAKGGKINDENAQMVLNQNTQIKHHTEELKSAVKSGADVPAWVVAKINRSANDISDATHYLEGETKMSKGGKLKYADYYAKGGRINEGNINELVGCNVEHYFTGKKEPVSKKILNVKVTPARFSNRSVKLYYSNNVVDEFPLSKLDEFVKGKEIKINTGDGDAYVIVYRKKMEQGGGIEEGKLYLIGKPEVFNAGRFNSKISTFKTAIIDDTHNIKYGQQSFKSMGTFKPQSNHIKITQKDFNELIKNMKMQTGGDIMKKGWSHKSRK
jgi:hypothetical protein